VDPLERAKVRAALLFAYEAAVITEARERGGNPQHFGEAAAMLPPEQFARMRDGYRKQIEALDHDSSSPADDPSSAP
jgi:hypothetical protein